MKPFILGIDTSNYTTSLAVVSEGEVLENIKLPLTVAEGSRGLRQSDAVFLHTRNLPEAFERLGCYRFSAVGVSATPRDEKGSYMPCFLAGLSAASAIARTNGIPLFRFSHQRGHFAAAAYSAGALPLLEQDFIGFHVSGGTTEIVRHTKTAIELLGGTDDINAGQAIDRVGVTLSLTFPCGPALERLAEQGTLPLPIKPSVKGLHCNLSGVENKAASLKEKGISEHDIALYVIEYISRTLDALSQNVRELHPDLPILYAGGVMSNKRIKQRLSRREEVHFAEPVFSSDNAAGIALLAEREWKKT